MVGQGHVGHERPGQRALERAGEHPVAQPVQRARGRRRRRGRDRVGGQEGGHRPEGQVSAGEGAAPAARRRVASAGPGTPGRTLTGGTRVRWAGPGRGRVAEGPAQAVDLVADRGGAGGGRRRGGSGPWPILTQPCARREAAGLVVPQRHEHHRSSQLPQKRSTRPLRTTDSRVLSPVVDEVQAPARRAPRPGRTRCTLPRGGVPDRVEELGSPTWAPAARRLDDAAVAGVDGQDVAVGGDGQDRAGV